MPSAGLCVYRTSVGTHSGTAWSRSQGSLDGLMPPLSDE